MEKFFTSINGYLYLSEIGLVSSGMNRRTLQNQISLNKSSKNLFFDCTKLNGVKWIRYDSIPEKILKKFKLLFKSEEILEFIKRDQKFIKDKESLMKFKKIRFILHQVSTDDQFWMQYKPLYRDYLFDNDIWNLLAKTHAVFSEILVLKEDYTLVDIHKAYITLDSVIFKTFNYKYFTDKIRRACRIGIDDCLIHNFKRFGRDPYKLNDLVKRRIRYYYSLPKIYSTKKIACLVNEELSNRNLKTISYSTVQRFIANQELRNISDPMRYGEKYAKDHIDPYIIRKKPKKSGDVLEVDTTELNFLLKNEEDKIYKLHLCALMDVCSGKILGHSIDKSENTEMTLKCLYNGFKKLRTIPRMIVHDNHQSYLSERFKQVSSKLDDFGIILRRSKPRNPGDKGHIEKWFDTFKNGYLKYEKSYIGDGIRSKREGGRVNRELERLYSTKQFIRFENDIRQIVSDRIDEYNSSANSIKEYPNKIFQAKACKHSLKFKKGDLSSIFLKERIITVRNSIISIKKGCSRYTYPINNRYLANKLNRSSVIVRFDESDYSKIDIYSNPKDYYEGTLFLERGINIILNNEDELKLRKHLKRKKERIFQNLDDLCTDMEKGWEELRSIPIIAQDDKFDTKEIEAYTENQMLISKTYPVNKLKKDLINESRKNKNFLKFRSKEKNQYREIK